MGLCQNDLTRGSDKRAPEIPNVMIRSQVHAALIGTIVDFSHGALPATALHSAEHSEYQLGEDYFNIGLRYEPTKPAFILPLEELVTESKVPELQRIFWKRKQKLHAIHEDWRQKEQRMFRPSHPITYYFDHIEEAVKSQVMIAVITDRKVLPEALQNLHVGKCTYDVSLRLLSAETVTHPLVAGSVQYLERCTSAHCPVGRNEHEHENEMPLIASVAGVLYNFRIDFEKLS
jgi:hypothetical protein